MFSSPSAKRASLLYKTCFQTISKRVWAADESLPFRYNGKCFLVSVKVDWTRDRGLDHAVEKERDLKQVLAVKDMAIKEPAATLPLRAVTHQRENLGIRVKVSSFLKKYSNYFETFKGEKGVPTFRLSKEALKFDEEERELHTEMEPDTASRLCKLLMMTRPKKLHIQLLDQFKWDLGLPYDYVKSLVPNYPDCFRIVKMEDNNPGLELVWWNHDLAFSALEERAMKKGGYKRGMPLEFPMVFPKDMELKHKVRERIAEWQKLPYISPYEDFSRKDLKGDFAERRMVAIMHELLSLMVHKRAPRKLLARLQGPLDLPERFEKSFKWYPGMFYQCTRAGTLNVLLREAFKRDELIDEHPLVNLRGRIMHFLVQGYIKYKRSLMERRPEPEIEKKKRRRGSSLKQKLRNSEHGLSSDDEESAHECEEESEDEYEEGSEEEGDEMIGTGHRPFRRFETRSYASLNSNVRRDNSPRTRQGDSKRSIRFGREGPRQKTFGNRRGGFQSYPEAGRRRQSSRLGREEWKAIG